MPPELILTIAKYFPLLFVFAFGASVGSLLNVVVYRLPRGEGLVFPSSRCPHCGTKLTWRENVPIVGWLALRGKCRFCRSPISPEYPIVEAFVAVLFTLTAFLWYVVPSDAVWLGVHWGRIRPEWAETGLAATWPMLGLLFTLMACLVAMTLIDARTFTIPLVLTWIPAAAAAVVHPVHAGMVRAGVLRGYGTGLVTAPGWTWTIPTPGWAGLGAGVGGVIGLGIGLGLLRLGLIKRSFQDYEAWERKALADQQAGAASVGGTASGPAASDDPTQLWIQYPHARREMVRELAFLAPCVVLMVAGAWAGSAYAATHQAANPDPFLPPIEASQPLWLQALGGVLIGYLAGGGVVWAVRIFGSLGFGKEAMGLGDVHLMAAVGACLGWIDATLAFFAAAFVGMAWWLLSGLTGGRLPRTIPYGPYLAVATLLVIFGKPLIEVGLTRMLSPPEGGMPINIP